MNTSELRSHIGNIRSNYFKGLMTGNDAKTELESINWDSIEEDIIPKEGLQTIVAVTLNLINKNNL